MDWRQFIASVVGSLTSMASAFAWPGAIDSAVFAPVSAFKSPQSVEELQCPSGVKVKLRRTLDQASVATRKRLGGMEQRHAPGTVSAGCLHSQRG